MPTYRAVIDLLLSVGFSYILEIIGTDGKSVWGYEEGITRSFVAFKKGSKFIELFKQKLSLTDVANL